MPFGLKNAPQIYQRLIDNALYGHLRIGPRPHREEGKGVLTEAELDTESGPSVLGRRSYIDDILVIANSWGDLCKKVEKLLDACNRWNLSINVAKRSWGCRKVSANGLEASLKELDALANLPFSRTLLAMQSFRGSLNYYSRFIEVFAVYAAVLYELRKADFHEMRRTKEVYSADQKTGDVPSKVGEDDRWTIAKIAFATLKANIVATPILRHFDPCQTPMVIHYANKWAVFAALMQQYDGVHWPVTFTNRTLKSNEFITGYLGSPSDFGRELYPTCHAVDQSIATILHAGLALEFIGTLEITKSSKGEEGILGTIGASIKLRAKVEEALAAIAPRKQPRKILVTPPPTIGPEEMLLVASFDGSARTKRKGRTFGAIIWNLPEWSILEAMSEYNEDLTVNEAEYRGLLFCFDLLFIQDRGRVMICGDSNLVTRQMRGEIECRAPGLQLLHQKALNRLRSWPRQDFMHMKRAWNQSADRLPSADLQHQEGEIVTAE
ncbi:reverse transcriptase [Phytophthora palmivora]|uniref:Reverse transcriptase n=1 Tax=Phytophthora palmivora TaxID=4796 RepID=A0A2P4XA59_9STRA|nr:reverse transcriptase [Phytophthora palmivora]